MTQVPLIQGHIGFEYKGDHSLTETYNKLNWVRGTDGAYVYIAEEPSLGSPQTDLTKWAVLSRDGTNGTNGVDGRDGVDGTSASLLDTFKVGYVYISLDATSPATLFGGTWAALGGRMLLGADGTYAAGSTGGSETHNHSLKGYGVAAITFNGSGKNVHFNEEIVSGVSFPVNIYWNIAGAIPSTYEASHQAAGASLAGSTSSVSGLPPYYAVYMWRRTA